MTMTGIVLALLMVCGIRQGVQQGLFTNGWFPTVRFNECQSLISYSFAALLAYHTTLYFMLANRFCPAKRHRGIVLVLRQVVTVFLSFYAFLVVMAIMQVLMTEIRAITGNPIYYIPYGYLIFGVPALLQIIITPYFGIYCYKNQEIES
jgi:hypothetical protein